MIDPSAYLNKSGSPKDTSRILLAREIAGRYFKCSLVVDKWKLSVYLNDTRSLWFPGP